ncbi:hypothetical protein DRN73_08515 [Candidatus Pacearchaeota archaeon]|nr:MAG: hypothetical protein DRN73_08515 [Candidatus Pacearchaeota archaeon]
MREEINGILFDLDGVLIDSSDAWWFAVNATLKKFGKKKVSKEEFLKTYWGPHLRESFRKINLGEDAIEDCNKQYYKFVDKIKIFPESREVLSILKEEKKLKIGLVTNTPREITLFSLKKFSLLNYFDVIIGGDDVKKGKPDPEMMLKACKLLNIKPKHVALVGDTKSDIIAGRRAGIRLIIGLGIDNADIKIKKLDEILKI